jgi:hypothetical protein
MSRRSKYTDDEIAYIRENYKMMTVRELAEHLDRGETALRQKMWELKIHKHDCDAKPKPRKDDKRLIRFPRG